MSAVMMTLINAPKIRVPEKVAGVRLRARKRIVALVLAAPVIMKRAVVRAPPVAMMPGVRVVHVMMLAVRAVRVTIARAVVAAIGTIAASA